MVESFYLIVFAMVMEFVDSALGMMYGTVLSPFLILLGYDVKTVGRALHFDLPIHRRFNRLLAAPSVGKRELSNGHN